MWNTVNPLASSQRRRRSSKRNVLKLPMWAKFQMVGPQVYSETRPGVRGVNVSSRRVMVL